MNFRIEGYTGPLNEVDAAEYVRPYFAADVRIEITAMVCNGVDVTDLSQLEPRQMRAGAAIVGTATR